jgi:hypothetical protein
MEDVVSLEVPTAVAGALLIAAAHVFNLNLCRECPSCA